RIEADAYGKMLLPSKDTLNQVLRVKTVQTILENDSLKEGGNQSAKMRIVTCRWYSRGYRYPVFETIRSINLQDSVKEVFNTAFFYPPQEQYYLQDEANLAVLDSLQNANLDPWAGLTYNIYPNPVKTTPLNVELYLPQPATVRVQVRNTMGTILIDKTQGKYPVGICNFQLNLQGIPTNNYILDIWLNDHLISYTIMKR
ncbi:MAG: T9SS type A sorting domain-containing protein, partial [Candidatus Symbiothrix sp.]|nr:T9SS type A sorting domain-containing protein [Candidatus Symbiothrix sp.]